MEFIEHITPMPKISNYIIFKEIGKGAYGVVFDGLHKCLKVRVAIKKVKKVHACKFRKEIFSLKRLNHPNITSLIDIYSAGLSYYIIMDFATGCNLHTYMARNNMKLEENTCKTIGRQLASALCYMHGERIAHRDIKPDNIVINDMTMKVKLVDLGLSGFVEENKLLTAYCGTELYIAPEIFRNQPYDVRVDMWSLGITFYEMLTGIIPQFRLTQNAQCNENIKEILKIHLLAENIRNTTAHFQNMLLNLLQPEPSKRIDSFRLCQHPWLTESFKKPITTCGYGTLPTYKQYRIYKQLGLITKKTISQTENIVKTAKFGDVLAMYKMLKRIELEKLHTEKCEKQPIKKRSLDDCSDYSKKRVRMKSVQAEMLC